MLYFLDNPSLRACLVCTTTSSAILALDPDSDQVRPCNQGAYQRVALAVKETECRVSRGLWKMLRVTKRAFRSYVWNNKTNGWRWWGWEKPNYSASVQLPFFFLFFFFLVKEMASLIGQGRIKVKEENEAMTTDCEPETIKPALWP